MSEEAPVPQAPKRESRTLLKDVFKRVKRLAKELWIYDIAIALHCTKCGQPLQQVGNVGVMLICKCRERLVR